MMQLKPMGIGDILDIHMTTGVGIARKGGLAARDVLNARSADEVLAFARARRERRGR